MAAPRRVLFQQPGEIKDESDNNWKTLIQTTYANSFVPGTTGFSGVTSTEAYYFTQGPLLHFAVTHIGADIQWTVTTAVVKLPVLPSKSCRHIGVAAYGNAGVELDQFVHATDGLTLVARAGYAVAGQTAITIQGWYFRD